MAESSAKRRRVDDDGGGGGEVPPLLDEYGYFFSPGVKAALEHYDEDMLQRITDKYTVNAQDRGGRTMLIMAALNGWVASVRFLIERGAAVNIQDKYKWTALHEACGPDNDVSDEEFEEMLLLLLRAGAVPTLKDSRGTTPRDMCRTRL